MRGGAAGTELTSGIATARYGKDHEDCDHREADSDDTEGLRPMLAFDGPFDDSHTVGLLVPIDKHACSFVDL